MSGSGSFINYYLRPSKCIERKMLCESFHRLREFGQLNSYKYIGFGAKYFTDFILFHKELGIHKMISIEVDETKKESFEFNKPLNCIQLEFGSSTEVIPSLNMEIGERSIIWLDYDETFNLNIILDIKYILSIMQSGSIFLMSCNYHLAKDGERLKYLKDNFGDRVPLDLHEKDLIRKSCPSVIQRMINELIIQALDERNSGLGEDEKFVYQQLYYFVYQDGAPMVTIGGILFQEKDRVTFNKCQFDTLDFVAFNNIPYDIDIPVLTYKEIQCINKILPYKNDEAISEITHISEKDIKKYAKLYRYFPHYMEIQAFN